ncbi:MAG: hypothetical protein JWO12_2143, partial [Frankiales bacterium]|nr:hypothetical protein [Frankiales bacterium]
MLDPFASWWRRRASWPTLPVADLVALKGDRTVSVLVPALNEQATVEGVLTPLLHDLVP